MDSGDIDKARRIELSTGVIGKSLADNYVAALLLPLDLNEAVNYNPKGEKSSHLAIAFVHGGLCPKTYNQLLPFPAKINKIADGLVKKLQSWLPTVGAEGRYSTTTDFVLFPCRLIALLRRVNR